MRTIIFFHVVFMLSGWCVADYYQGSNYYCKSFDPQRIVDISQLEGIWYVIEKILHTEELHYVVNVTTCPVIHISEDRRRSTTYNPIYKTYDTTYGSNYPYDLNPSETGFPYSNEQQYNKQQEEYDRRTTYDYQRRKNNQLQYVRHLYTMKHLRIYWDDSSSTTEYNLRYNVSQPGFWISSGPEGGTAIPENQKHFAGVIQVIKAVGSHLALTFCHHMPQKNQLFTIILARDSRLERTAINSVHGLLVQRGLQTNAVEKSCNKAPVAELSLTVWVSVLGFYLVYIVK